MRTIAFPIEKYIERILVGDLKMNIFDVYQLLGGIILTAGQIPQIIQLIKTKSSRDLNLITYFMIFLGILLMEIYAINWVLNGSGHAYLITNTISLIESIIIFLLAWKYKNKKCQRNKIWFDGGKK